MRVLQALLFYPRGGSAHVARSLSRELVARGHEVRVVAGSLGGPGDFSHAQTFYAGLDVSPMDYNPAREDFRTGRDPMESSAPFHPSYEDRGPVPDRLFAAVSPKLALFSEEAWKRHLSQLRAFDPEVVHVHHLTPQGFAARTLFEKAALIVHLHGTELKMLERIRSSPRRAEDPKLAFGEFWLGYLTRLAQEADQIVVVSPNDAERASDLLGIPMSRFRWIPNGVDLNLFRAIGRPEVRDGRLQVLRRFLVEDPQGWRPGAAPGSVRYSDADLERAGLDDPSTFLIAYVGRFTGVKRADLLVETFASSRAVLGEAALIVWGGFPGEWEGRHPVEVSDGVGAEGVFFAGWRSHEDLASFMPFIDLLVLPSVDESFGQVLVEAMACGKPVIAVNRGGPPSFVRDHSEDANGWLIPPDDPDGLIAALSEAAHDEAGRLARGGAGRRMVEDRFSWEALAQRFERIYADAITR